MRMTLAFRMKNLREELKQLSAGIDAERQATALQSSIASEALKKCDELQGKVWSLEAARAAAHAKSEGRKQGLEDAVKMLRFAEDDPDSDDFVRLDKRRVADFFLALAVIEDT